jgi:cytochrome b
MGRGIARRPFLRQDASRRRNEETAMALRDFNRTMLLPFKVWDLFIRAFHWLIVVLLVVSYVSVEAGWMEIHLTSGYTVMALLITRIVWGFVGSETARFSSFLVSPVRGLRHLTKFGERTPDTQVGHNEAGGWMVLAMLALLAVQVFSGLFNTEEYGEDYAAAGPLARYVSEGFADFAGAVHEQSFNLLFLFVVLHVAAVAAYKVVKKHDLVRPMITGVKRLPAATRQPRMVSPLIAAGILLVSAGLVWLLATRV